MTSWRGAFAALFGLVLALGAQNTETFKARIYPVPIEASMRAEVTGLGSAQATLAGTKLTVNGTFEGLHSPATVARLHIGSVTGVRGPVAFELTVAKSTSGNISGSFDLTREQIDSLRKGNFYIQLHSQKAPDGNLWGWFLK